MMSDCSPISRSIIASGDELTIKSSRSQGKLKFSERQFANRSVEYICVTLADRELNASTSRIYLYQPDDLVAFFEELAREWKGWKGEKEWKSVEGDLALSVTADGLGVVALRVTLKSGPYEDDWCVQTLIHVDAGQLEDLAVTARAFLHAA